jgi:hypothetical protein
MKKIAIFLSLIVSVNSQSLQFDGADDYIDLGIISTIDFTKDFSIQVWIKTTSNKGQGVFVKSNGDNTLDAGEKSLFIEGAGFPWFGNGDEGYIPATGYTVNDGLWHHIIVTYSKSDGLGHIYVDGVNATQNNDYFVNTADNSEDKIYLGIPNHKASNAPNYFDGSIKEVVIWNTRIGEDDISKLFGDGHGAAANALITLSGQTWEQGYWKLNEGIGEIVVDKSNKENNGTIYGAKWIDGESSFNDKGTKAITFNVELPAPSLQDTNISLAFWKSGAENHECTGCNGRDTVTMRKISDKYFEATVGLDTTLVANGETGESQYWYHYFKTIPDYKINEDLERFKLETNPDGLRALMPGWHQETSLVNKDTVIAWQNIAPVSFDWVSSALDTINITKTNLTDTYELKWSESKDVDIDTIDYLISVSVGQLPADMIHETADTSMTIYYQDIIDTWYPNFAMLSRGTLKFSVSATDGIDTVKVSGDDRVLFVNRYEYLSTEGEGVPVEFALHENYPNPFNPTTTLRFDLPEVSNLTLTIYNMLGQKVRTFNYQNTSAGYHSVTWDAANDLGQQVGAGVYLYQLQTKDFVKTRKMVLLK